ncbi:MAG: hypothetical protein A2W08_03745 [Candidatus Rokubacteria bacterium RBG_16_73_20]|nr:MAG: hypothetical protein A2W08_03745 [Candidatus Rokubacteria bacterium RBG_16_73_20]HAM59583.1 hypothetical protein [Candidatus Rokubacteria bacterium]HBH00726.1 hypothetical protein [Candidatus Rokubacteria bacterium]
MDFEGRGLTDPRAPRRTSSMAWAPRPRPASPSVLHWRPTTGHATGFARAEALNRVLLEFLAIASA